MKLGTKKTLQYHERLMALCEQIETIQRDLTNEARRGGPHQLPQVGDDLGEAHTALFNAQQRLLEIEDYPSLPRRVWRRFVNITIGPSTEAV